MTRQLGPPTFFVIFTSAKQNWSSLYNALESINRNSIENPHKKMMKELWDDAQSWTPLKTLQMPHNIGINIKL